jgi:hypothetical protein
MKKLLILASMIFMITLTTRAFDYDSTCTTNSNNLTFTVTDQDYWMARHLAIKKCVKSGTHTDVGECFANVYCDTDPVRKIDTECTTSSKGKFFSKISKSSKVAKDNVVRDCKQYKRSIWTECEANVMCRSVEE